MLGALHQDSMVYLLCVVQRGDFALENNRSSWVTHSQAWRRALMAALRISSAHCFPCAWLAVGHSPHCPSALKKNFFKIKIIMQKARLINTIALRATLPHRGSALPASPWQRLLALSVRPPRGPWPRWPWQGPPPAPATTAWGAWRQAPLCGFSSGRRVLAAPGTRGCCRYWAARLQARSPALAVHIPLYTLLQRTCFQSTISVEVSKLHGTRRWQDIIGTPWAGDVFLCRPRQSARES